MILSIRSELSSILTVDGFLHAQDTSLSSRKITLSSDGLSKLKPHGFSVYSHHSIDKIAASGCGRTTLPWATWEVPLPDTTPSRLTDSLIEPTTKTMLT